MQDIPVILLTFANDQDDYLFNLKAESSAIIQTLAPLEDRRRIQVYREESAETEDLLRALIRFDGRIALFHYAGHAHGKGLKLEGGDGRAEGLAKLLGRQEHLQLVFLNGCSTGPQVSQLLTSGVRAVIATSAPIDDDQATSFAKHFYDKLAVGSTIRQAFEFAADSLALSSSTHPRPSIKGVSTGRGQGLENEVLSESIPWGLYHNASEPESLEWRIPVATPTDAYRPASHTDYEVNEYLYAVLESMAAFDDEIRDALDRMEDEREYFEMVIKNFPWNIGAQFGLLVGEHSPSRSRLEQIVSTYLACIQWIYFVPLSQLWQEQSDNRVLEAELDRRSIFGIAAENYLTYDYCSAFEQLIALLEKHQIPLFVQELSPLAAQLRQGGPLYRARLLLESTRSQCADDNINWSGPELISRCADAEYALSEVLCELAFLVNYQMVTVRDIVIFNPRHLNTRFRHKIGRLNAHTDERLFFFRQPKSFDAFLQSDSVLLLQDPDQVENYLNLTPFYIDRNAFRDKSAELTDLYTFAFAKKQPEDNGWDYYYLKSSRNLLNGFHNQLDQLCTNEQLVSDIRQRGLRGLKNRVRRQEQEQQPYALLKEQFDHLLKLLENYE